MVEPLCSNFGLNNIYLVIEIIHIQKYTLSCKTGSDSKRNAYMKVISCLNFRVITANFSGI